MECYYPFMIRSCACSSYKRRQGPSNNNTHSADPSSFKFTGANPGFGAGDVTAAVYYVCFCAILLCAFNISMVSIAIRFISIVAAAGDLAPNLAIAGATAAGAAHAAYDGGAAIAPYARTEAADNKVRYRVSRSEARRCR